MGNASKGNYILGLDVGANSIGWAICPAKSDDEIGEPGQTFEIGVRVFEEGVDVSKGSLQAGSEKSRNVRRREARQQRRQQDRRSRRIKHLFALLQTSMLLPEGEAKGPEGRHRFLLELDKSIYSKYLGEGSASLSDKPANAHVVPYWLRARALDHKLEPYELGRVLYHLAQRRGLKAAVWLLRKKMMKKKKEKLRRGLRTYGRRWKRLVREHWVNTSPN